MSWPSIVPIFTAAHISKLHWTNKKNPDCRCTYQWLWDLFGSNTPEFKQARTTLGQVLADDDSYYDLQTVGCMTSILCWNDNDDNPKKYIAKILNRLMQALGYTEEVWY